MASLAHVVLVCYVAVCVPKHQLRHPDYLGLQILANNWQPWATLLSGSSSVPSASNEMDAEQMNLFDNLAAAFAEPKERKPRPHAASTSSTVPGVPRVLRAGAKRRRGQGPDGQAQAEGGGDEAHDAGDAEHDEVLQCWASALADQPIHSG